MADNTIINCDAQGNIFTGVTNCGVFDTGDYFGTFISKKGTKVPNDTTFLAKFKEEVQKNNIIPFKGYDYRNAHEENQMATSSIGNMQLQRLGKPMLEFDVVGSVCEMKQLSKVNNLSSNWDVWVLYENALICATASDGKFTGFDLNVLTAESTKLKQGADLQMKTLKAQLRSSTQWNEGMTLIPLTTELAELKELAGIVSVNIAITITNGTTLDVTVTDACTGNGIDGLTTLLNFQLTGVQTSATAIDAIVANGEGNYTFTLDPTLVATDTVGVKLATAGFQSVLIDGVYYGGSSNIATYTP